MSIYLAEPVGSADVLAARIDWIFRFYLRVDETPVETPYGTLLDADWTLPPLPAVVASDQVDIAIP
jgi:hypothetical protein